jgi:antitoxin HicB
MRSFVYPAILTTESKGVSVRFPDLPEALSSGKDRADALLEAADCLEEAIAGRIADHLEIPEPSSPRRKHSTIPLTAPMAAKAALYLAIKDARVSNSELARRLKLDEREIRRMLNPRHSTRLARIQAVLEVLGKRLVVSMESAAGSG